MVPGGGNPKPDAFRSIGEIAARANDLRRQLLDRSADLGTDFDDRLVHLALDVIAESGRARRQELLHVGSQLPRVGIDDLEFLLDADRESVLHAAAIIVREVSI